MIDNAALEFDAMKAVHAALEPLGEDARQRVLVYIASLFRLEVKGLVSGGEPSRGDVQEAPGESAVEEPANAPTNFSSFAELHDAAEPKTNSERALVVAYWLQVCLGADTFTAAAANKELTHLGHKVANITAAIDDLRNQRPALVLQLKKSGTSQQARKTYKVSVAGIRRVEEMTNG